MIETFQAIEKRNVALINVEKTKVMVVTRRYRRQPNCEIFE